MTVPRMLLWLCLVCAVFSANTQKEADRWTLEPFAGTLSGQTVTVTGALWKNGPLTREGQTGPLRPEAAFALRCFQAALPEGTLIADHASGYRAEMIASDREAGGRLLESAWRFGLIVSRETEERFYLHYVGPVHAAAMHALDMDLEAYLLFLHRTGQAALNRNGRTVAWVFCIPDGEAVSFTLPEGAAWEISGDDAGCVIIAVRSGC